MSQTVIGILLGLVAAASHSFCYIFTRRFVVKSSLGSIGLMSLNHIWMGTISLALLPLLWDSAHMPPLRDYLVPALFSTFFYLLGQFTLFYILRRADASRVSTLLSLKILMLALIAVLYFHQHLGVMQWVAVGLSIAAAIVMNYSGVILGARIMILLLLGCLFYCLSDLGIRETVTKFIPTMGLLRGSLISVCMIYSFCGLAGLALLPLVKRPQMVDWKYALPVSLTWWTAMVFLFGCFATIGVVYGNIIQSTRGLISVLLGAQLAVMGMSHLEQKASKEVWLRRVISALMMTAAIGLYLENRM